MGRRALENKPHLVNWVVICVEKKKMGLDIKVLSSLNKALLDKWIWRFVLERDPHWRCVIMGKIRGRSRRWCPMYEGRVLELYYGGLYEGFGVLLRIKPDLQLQ